MESAKSYGETFLGLDPTSGEEALFKTIVIAFPNVTADSATELIDGSQRELKTWFVAKGLMIGEFHERNRTPGTHNSKFFPNQSPIPALAIRHMVVSDLRFLNDPKYSPPQRLKFIYLSVDVRKVDA